MLEEKRKISLKKAQFYFEQKNYSKSASLYRYSWSLNRDDFESQDVYQMLLSLIVIQKKAPSSFLKSFMNKILFMIRYLEALLAQLNVNYSEKRKEKCLLNMLVVSPFYTKYYFILAEDKIEIKKFKEALEFYTLILQVDPNNKKALKGKAEVLTYIGAYEESLKIYEMLLKDKQDDAYKKIESQYNRVKALSLINRLEEKGSS